MTRTEVTLNEKTRTGETLPEMTGSGLGRLFVSEARLFLREPLSLIFVLAFPALLVLILGGVFERDDPGFGGATPSDFYVAAYFTVALAAVGFITLPAHLAGYREHGVLRRFRASPFPAWALPVAWAGVSVLLCLAGFVVLLVTAALSYGIPQPQHLSATLLALLSAVLTYVSVGILLGLAIPTARAAQGIGMLLFFPSFLLGGGGPPPAVMPAVMRHIADALPMTQALRAVQNPWLGLGPAIGSELAWVVVTGLAATAGWLCLARRDTDR